MTTLLWVGTILLLVGCRQETRPIDGNELLDKMLAYHDPYNSWDKLSSTVQYHEYRPDNTMRKSLVHFNNAGNSFKMERASDQLVITRGTVGDSCYVLVNGSPKIEAQVDSTLNLDCQRSLLYRDYYVYMQGLPMKLRDYGTIIENQVDMVTFLGSRYYKLKVSYDEMVGSDVWYFYVNPETYAIQAYQFYHDESKGDGEYIVLEGIIEHQGMIWPRERTWYTNIDDQYLGKDVIVNIINK